MKSIVVYESYYGNTKNVAEKIALNVDDCLAMHVDDLDKTQIKEDDLIIIGSPTRAFRSSKKINTFIKQLPKNIALVAVFDTRMHITDETPKFLKILEKKFGYATDTMVKIIKKRNLNLYSNTGEFFVIGTEGPLAENEEEKIQAWALKLNQHFNKI